MPRRKWTDEEKQLLIDNHGKMTNKQIANVLGRSESTVEKMIKKLNLQKKEVDRSEVPMHILYKDYLEKNYMTKSYEEMRQELGLRNKDQIKYMLTMLNLTGKRCRIWEDEEIEFLKNNYMIMSDIAIGQALNRSDKVVRKKRKELGLERNFRVITNLSDRNWKEEEIKFLCDNHGKMTYKEIATFLNRSYKAISIMAFRLGLTGGNYDTSIEIEVQNILDFYNIEYIKQFPIGSYKIDFYIPKSKVAIEVNGDYWHCNPNIYDKPVSEQQLYCINKDKEKYDLLKSFGIDVIVFWESDIINNRKKVEDIIQSLHAEMHE